MTSDELYGALLPTLQQLLAEHWDHILIGGQKVDDKYGVTLDTMLKHHCGFIPPGFPLADEICKLGMEPLHVVSVQGHGLLTFAKQLHETRPFFEGRILFAYKESDKVTYWSGRETDLTPTDHPIPPKQAKYLHMRLQGQSRPLYLQPEPETYLVEGHFHALILRQHGFAGVATGSKFPSEAQISKLRRTDRIFWIPDVDVLAPEKPGMRSRADGTKFFNSGRTSHEKLADLLPTLRHLPQTRVVQYPAEFLSETKGDLNDFFAKYSLDDFVGMLTSALDPDDIEVQSIPQNLSAQERSQKLEDFARTVARRSPVETNALLNHLSRHLKLGKDETKHIREIISNFRKVGTPKEDIENNATKHRRIFPGMDYVNGILYYTVARRTLVQKRIEGQLVELVEETPWMVSSLREIFPATEIELARRNLYFARNTDTKGAQLIWNDASEAKWSIPDFIENSAKPDTKELYTDLRNYFRTYLYLKDDEYYDVLALFTMLSYCVQMFNSSPILGANGIKGSGKTRLLDLLDTVGFNSQMASSASPSSVYRFVESCNGMLILDEQEKLHSVMKTRTEFDDLSLILNSCYKKGGGAMRSIGENNENHVFRTYTTAVVANQNGFHPTLASRMIILPIVRAEKSIKIPEWTRFTGEKIGGELQQRLFCWTLSNAGVIKECYDRFCGELSYFFELASLFNRERECWIALFSLALTVDTLSGSPWNPDKQNPLPRPEHSTLLNLLNAQASLTARKQELMNSDETFSLLLAALRDIIQSQDSGEGCAVRAETVQHKDIPDTFADSWYSVKELTTDLNKREGLEFFPAKQGQRALGLVLKKAEVIGEHELKTKVRIGGERTTAIRLTKEAIDKACERFDVPKELVADYVDRKGSKGDAEN